MAPLCGPVVQASQVLSVDSLTFGIYKTALFTDLLENSMGIALSSIYRTSTTYTESSLDIWNTSVNRRLKLAPKVFYLNKFHSMAI